MIDLSIIIVNYNGSKFLEDCINSVYKGTHKISFEIILIDNNSSDNSVEIVKTKFPKVKLIQNKKNLGFCKANNQGLKIYQGRYALLLNTDTVTKNEAFDRMVEFMDTHPKVGACGPKLLNPDGAPQHQGGIFARRFWLSNIPVKVDYVIGACLMVRWEVVDKVGGLDENFFFSNDDLDWCRRIKKAGWDVYFLPQAEVIHYGGFTTKRFNQKLFVEGFRGGLYFCKKHYGNIIYQIYRMLLAPSMLIAAFFSALFYPFLKNKQKLAAYLQIFSICLKGAPLPLGEGNKRGEGKSILLISNGHAEDLAAAAIGARLKKSAPEIDLKALPLVGLGKAYDKEEIENLGLKKILPSGGFAKEGLCYLLKDIWYGLLGLIPKQISILSKEGKKADLVVAVGDVFLVALCGLFTRKPLIYIDGPNSVRIREYYPVEKWLLRKFCTKTIVQDEETAKYLQNEGLPGLYLGSWVMDYIAVTGEDFGTEKDKIVIGMLPGTREEAYDNLLLILEVFDEMNKKARANENFLGLVASTLNLKKIKGKIKKIKWNFIEPSASERNHSITGKLSTGSDATVLISEGKFGDVCMQSKLIIGLAGIANEQAVAFGKPVVCFPGKGAQTTLRRWQEIHKITGDSIVILSGSASEKAGKILEILRNPELMQEMSRIGKESKPQWGGVDQIADLIVKN